MRVVIITLMILALTACSRKQELMPDWYVRVCEDCRLINMDNRLYLTTPNGNFEIDLQTGNKTAVSEKIVGSYKKELRKIGIHNNLKRWELINEEKQYSLVKSYSATDDCQLPLYNYWLEKIDEDKEKFVYTLGKYERYNVLDFKVIQKALYIVKNPANGGDAYHLEKYRLE